MASSSPSSSSSSSPPSPSFDDIDRTCDESGGDSSNGSARQMAFESEHWNHFHHNDNHDDEDKGWRGLIPVNEVARGYKSILDRIVDDSLGDVDDAIASNVGECSWLSFFKEDDQDRTLFSLTSVETIHHSFVTTDGLVRIPNLGDEDNDVMMMTVCEIWNVKSKVIIMMMMLTCCFVSPLCRLSYCQPLASEPVLIKSFF